MEKEQRYFPFFVDISEYRVLVVGAGIIALRRTSALLRFGTRVTVVAPDIRAEFQALQAQYGQEYVCLQQKKFTPGMTTGYDIVLRQIIASGRSVKSMVSGSVWHPIRRCVISGFRH